MKFGYLEFMQQVLNFKPVRRAGGLKILNLYMLSTYNIDI
jgi:hypothetical protein